MILGNNEKKDVVKFAEEALESKLNAMKVQKAGQGEAGDERPKKMQGKAGEAFAQVTDVLHCEEYSEFGDVTFTEKTRAVIKVQDGCDRFCSYCIIPYARGHIRSRRPEQVVSEITKIAQAGIREVVITGIHLASYGRDFGENNKFVASSAKDNEQKQAKYGLIDLLEEINAIEGIERIRLRFVGANTNNRRICGEVSEA